MGVGGKGKVEESQGSGVRRLEKRGGSIEGRREGPARRDWLDQPYLVPTLGGPCICQGDGWSLWPGATGPHLRLALFVQVWPSITLSPCQQLKAIFTSPGGTLSNAACPSPSHELPWKTWI